MSEERKHTPRTSIEMTFAMCEVCGKKNGRPGHDCDNGEALRKATRELFGPALHCVEQVIAKAGTGVLRGVFEIAFERDALAAQNAELVEALNDLYRADYAAQFPCTHADELRGVDDRLRQAREKARAALSRTKEQS